MFFFYEYARGRYVLNGRVTFSGLAYFVSPLSVSRATSSCTCMFLFPSYVFLNCTNMDRRLVSSHLLVSRFFFVLSTRLLTFLDYAFPFSSC